MADGHRLGIEAVRDSVKRKKPIQSELLAAEIAARFWRLEATQGGLSEADLATIENMAQHAAEKAWEALSRLAGVSVH